MFLAVLLIIANVTVIAAPTSACGGGPPPPPPSPPCVNGNCDPTPPPPPCPGQQNDLCGGYDCTSGAMSAADPGAGIVEDTPPAVSISWDFGDYTPMVKNVTRTTHIYEMPGWYGLKTYACWVDDPGNCSSTERKVHVQDPREKKRMFYTDLGTAGGCSGCGGKGGVGMDFANGRMRMPAILGFIPGGYSGGTGSGNAGGRFIYWPLDMRNCPPPGPPAWPDPNTPTLPPLCPDGSFVSQSGGAGAYAANTVSFSITSYASQTYPSLKLQVSDIAATVSMVDGSTITYSVPGGVNAKDSFGPSAMIDAYGRTTNLAYDVGSGTGNTGGLASITLPDGRSIRYSHVDLNDPRKRHFAPTKEIGPDGKVRRLAEYNEFEQITKETVADPDNPSNYVETIYEYYDYSSGSSKGLLRSITASSGLKTLTTYYDDRRVKMVRSLNELTNEVFSQTEYSCDTAVIDSVTYGRTTIREYRDVGTVWTPGVPGPGDRVYRRYYYLDEAGDNTYPHIAATVLNPDTPQEAEERTVYDVAMTPGLRGDVLTMTKPDGVVVTYDYYDPDKTYSIPAQGQYYYSGPGDILYAVDTTGQGVRGNGHIRTLTVRYPSGATYVESYRYYIKNTADGQVMTSDQTLMKDTLDRITKTVVDDKGNVTEVWETQDDGTLAMVKSFEYYTSGHTLSLGWLYRETTYDVGSGGEDHSLTYTYEFGTDGSQLHTVTGSSGRSYKTHYDCLGRTDWEQDVYSRRTDYQYDYQGRLVKTILPEVDGVRKTRESGYSCCHLLWEEDENEHRTYYEYDGMGRVKKTWTDVQGSQGPQVEYFYEGPFGATSKVVTYSDASSPRETVYSYDSLGRLARIDNPGDVPPIYDEYFQYDEQDRLAAKLVGVVDANSRVAEGYVTVFVYDEATYIAFAIIVIGMFMFPRITRHTQVQAKSTTSGPSGNGVKVLQVDGDYHYPNLPREYRYVYTGKSISLLREAQNRQEIVAWADKYKILLVQNIGMRWFITMDVYTCGNEAWIIYLYGYYPLKSKDSKPWKLLTMAQGPVNPDDMSCIYIDYKAEQLVFASKRGKVHTTISLEKELRLVEGLRKRS